MSDPLFDTMLEKYDNHNYFAEANLLKNQVQDNINKDVDISVEFPLAEKNKVEGQAVQDTTVKVEEPKIENARTVTDRAKDFGLDTGQAMITGAEKAGRNFNDFIAEAIASPDTLGDFIGQKITGNPDFNYPGIDKETATKNIQAGLTWFDENLVPEFARGSTANIERKYTNELYGSILEGISEFATGAVPAAKVVGLTKGMYGLFAPSAAVRGMAWGMIADATVIDPNSQELIAPVIRKFVLGLDDNERTALSDTVLSILEKNDPNSDVTNRIKTANEGAVIGALVEGIIYGAKVLPWKTFTKALGVVGTASLAAGKKVVDTAKRIEIDDSTLGSTNIPLRLRPEEKKGLDVSKDITEVNLRKHNKRLEDMKKGKPYPGGPLNKRTILKSNNKDLPEIAIGEITFDDWIKRVNATSTQKQIMEDKGWYGQVFPEFEKASGGNKKEMGKLAESWLSAQQNETPSSALSNVLFIFEQFKRGVPRNQVKGKGLPSANKIASDIIYEEKVTGGFGQKIADFIDSGYKKNTRSIMGNDPSMPPFVIDIHSARDLGFTDPEYINHLKRLGYKLPDNLKLDSGGGGIKDTKYENRAKFGRELTDHLNSINWQGKSDWQPMEIQAIGWMNMTRLYSGLSQGGDVRGAFARNTRRVSMEVDPGDGSPWQKQFGNDYNNLNDADKIKINNIVTAKAIEKVNKQEGITLGNVVHGTGGWELYQNPSTVSQAFASKEAAIKAGAKLGYLLNQTEVWVNSSKQLTKNAKHYGIDIVERGSANLRNSDELKKLFEAIIENEPNGLFRGYQPIIVDGEPGIRIIIDDVAIKNSPLTKKQAEEYIINFANNNGGLNKILQDLKFNVETVINEVELDKLRNNWKEKPNGEGYKKYYSEETRGSISSGSRANIDNDGVELTNIFSNELSKVKGKK